MKKFSLIETAKTVAANSGDESDVIFIVRSNGNCFTTSCTGLNKTFDAVKLAGHLRNFLEEKLAFALDVFDAMSDAGYFKFTRNEEKHVEVLNRDEDAQTAIDKLLESLAAAMESDKNENEH